MQFKSAFKSMKKSLYNLLTEIKNAQLNKTVFIIYKKTNHCKFMLNILWENGFILGYSLINSNEYKVFLKYYNNKPSVNSIRKLFSNQKRFLCLKQLWKIKTRNVILIITTNKGIKVLFECMKLNIGGEVLFLIN